VHHLHIDRFAGLSSPVHSVDARAKLLATLAFLFLVVLTPDGRFVSYIVYFALVSTVITPSHIPPGYVLKRSLALLPFTAAVSVFVPFITPGAPVHTFDLGPLEATVTDQGIIRFVSINSRALICFFATVTLVSTTRFGDLMRAAGTLGLPSKLVVILSFMYRYLFILIDDAGHMMLARDLRAYGRKRRTLLPAAGGIIGALFVRSFEHAERLYHAMMLRGYDGRPRSLTPMHLSGKDVIYAVSFLGLSLLGFAAGVCI